MVWRSCGHIGGSGCSCVLLAPIFRIDRVQRYFAVPAAVIGHFGFCSIRCPVSRPDAAVLVADRNGPGALDVLSAVVDLLRSDHAAGCAELVGVGCCTVSSYRTLDSSPCAASASTK